MLEWKRIDAAARLSHNNMKETIAIIADDFGISPKEARMFIMSNLKKESHYQKKIMEYLKTRPNSMTWKNAAGSYSISGVPDITHIESGIYFAFEVKRPLIGKPTDIQSDTIKEINQAGGCAAVIVWPEEAEELIEKRLREERQC